MKKLISLVLALAMLLALCACGAGSTEPEKPVEPAAPSESPVTPETPDVPAEPVNNDFTGELGMFDPNYDYSANPRYKIIYYTLVSSIIYEGFNSSFEHWAKVLNLDYQGWICANGEKDSFLSNLTDLANQYDGILIDADETQYNRVAEILDETGTPWMNCLGIPCDYTKEGMPLLHPYIGFDMHTQGMECGKKLLELKDELWPDVDLSEFGMISVTFSVSLPLLQRSQGAIDYIVEQYPDFADRSWMADCVIGQMDVDTCNTVVSSVLAQHAEYEYWLVFGLIDDMAPGATAALDTTGLTDRAAVVSIGGVGAQTQWDAGLFDSWKAAYALPDLIFAEPMICCLYAFMHGDTTPEDLWPEWHSKANPEYPMRMLPSYWVTPENYKEVFAWSDVYAEANLYPNYPKDGITRDTYSTHLDPPADY